ncbi:MAG: YkgJ family cysteine cluster protein [Candidatus Methanodesulfokora washburnensis]|jgi:Fe-S-cluster containining protein
MLLSWSKVKDWTCFACGECCKWFFVSLRPDEAVRISSTYGRDKIEIVHGKPILRRIGNSCVFLHGNLCLLGDEKPIACKLWPIIIMREGDAESYFCGYHVYFDNRCPGVQKGRPSDRLYRVIMEAIHLKEGRIIKQINTTAKIKSGLLPSTAAFIFVKKVPLLRGLSMNTSLCNRQSTLHFI